MLFKIVLLLLFILLPSFAFAQETPADTNIGQYSLPFILTAILGLLYKWAGDKIPDRFKPVIAAILGTALGYVALIYSGKPQEGKVIIEYLLFGFISGLGAVGTYELTRVAYNPRE
jgi:hypothetical protein